ncbi:hypothetical protein KEJ50_06485 [Candidatus Bathyarchaeota archaeon]|nr:hypothetical protein [Candidatus Bathyarchaeota archaeon]
MPSPVKVIGKLLPSMKVIDRDGIIVGILEKVILEKNSLESILIVKNKSEQIIKVPLSYISSVSDVIMLRTYSKLLNKS